MVVDRTQGVADLSDDRLGLQRVQTARHGDGVGGELHDEGLVAVIGSARGDDPRTPGTRT